ncbi:MAG TPA: ATP-binding protein [Blastocatellia bacterium]|nr:ATP-binding protein [Blastocatellia bacterium]
MNSMRLRSKLYLSFTAVLLLSSLITVLILVMMRASASSFKEIFLMDNQVARLVLSIKAEKLRLTESLREGLLRPNKETAEQQIKSFNAAYERIDTELNLTRQLTSDPQLLDMLDQIGKSDESTIKVLERRILDAAAHQGPAQAEQLYSGEYLQASNKQQQLLDQFNDMAAVKMNVSIERAQSKSELIGNVAIALGLVPIIIGFFFCSRLSRSILHPIEQMILVASAIASGEGSLRLTLDREDEFGEMADALNVMVTNLRKLNEDRNNQIRWLRKTKNELEETQTQLALQEQLMQQEKMAALGRMVAGVAHELNNPISFVYSNTVLLSESIAQLRKVLDFYDSCEDMPIEIKQKAAVLKEEIDYDYLVDDVSHALEDCHEGSSRVRDIVMNLKTFSRADELEWQLVDVTVGIESTIRMLGQFFRPDRVVVHRDYAEIAKIECYAGQLSQVWMNLMVNAAQAMDSQGDLWITTHQEGETVIVKFRDNGPGMPEDTVTKIFDPFFTTKAVGEGTGLGLSIVHGIIERHGGEIKVESQLGVGTSFTIRLPLTKCQSPDNALTEPEDALA